MLRNIVFKYDIFFNLYYRHIYKPKDELSSFLNDLSKRKKSNLFFIQVGANDGNWNDPIYKFIRRDGWSGILIEPQKVIYDRLLENYKRLSNLFFENVAIDSAEGEKNLYKISFSNSQWAAGISSFIKNDIQKLIDAGYVDRMSKLEQLTPPSNQKDWICEESVKVTTLRNIISKHHLKQIDLIMIDTEGYDFEIIKTIPFDYIKPEVIVYEHSHFNEQIKTECSDFLINAGYKLIHTESDTIAISKKVC